MQKGADIADIRSTVSNLDNEISSRLEEGKSMALGIILSEEGLVVKRWLLLMIPLKYLGLSSRMKRLSWGLQS